ncbi:peptidase c13 family domain-containing protein [Ditylenchus destructor]|nr:peptidase c13 family domain-containing protein [Ditylenchus destructor]
MLFSIICALFVLSHAQNTDLASKVENFFEQTEHTNNWAVLVCSSRFWFNYRHVANVLSIYRSIKRLGIPDSNIIVMLADQIPCNARNPDPATIYNNAYHHSNIFSEDVEVDYRGYEVTAENLVRLLTGRVLPATPRNKKLLSDRQSNVLIYLSGHGGDGFLKFQDAEELTNVDLADAIETMHQHNRYNELFVIADTCQSESMYQKIYSPRVLATSSSLVGQDSLSHHVDRSIGVYIIDRYAYYIQQFLDSQVKSLDSNTSMAEYMKACGPSQCISTVGVRTDLYEKPLDNVRVTDFFGGTRYTKGIDEAMYDESEMDFVLSQK